MMKVKLTIFEAGKEPILDTDVFMAYINGVPWEDVSGNWKPTIGEDGGVSGELVFTCGSTKRVFRWIGNVYNEASLQLQEN